MLFPEEVLLLRQERRIRKAALIHNFVDREKERPALGPNDFLVAEDTSTFPRKTGNIKRGPQSGKKNNISSNCQVIKKIRPKRRKNYDQICSDEADICNGMGMMPQIGMILLLALHMQ